MTAREEALSRCGAEAPCLIVPANHKWFRNPAMARVVVAHPETLKPGYPKPTADLERIRREYHAASLAAN